MAALSLFKSQATEPSREIEIIEKKLYATLASRSIWGTWPKQLIPPAGTIHLDVGLRGETLALCGNQVGGCVSYEYKSARIGDRIRAVSFARVDPDFATLRRFVGEPSSESGSGIQGVPKPSWVFWKATLRLGDRAQMMNFLRSQEPLDRWSKIRSHLKAKQSNSQIRPKMATVACFSEYEPIVHVYLERQNAPPGVLLMRWNDATEDWSESWHEDERLVRQYAPVIQSMSCAVIDLR